MAREVAVSEAYTKTKSSRFASGERLSSSFHTRMAPQAGVEVTVTPVYDVCAECGKRIRRKNIVG